VAAYSGMTGYSVLNPSTDRGTNADQGFSWWKLEPIGGYKLSDVQQIPPTSEGEIRSAISTKGGVLLCVELSTDNQNQRVWMPTGQAGSWGGHAVWCDEYDGSTYRITSWGEDFYIDRSYFNTIGFVSGVYKLTLTDS
jgi:hypothetical protein